MARKLTAEEMSEISWPWVTEGNPARAAMERVPLLAALWPQVQEAHAGLLALRACVDDPRARELSERQAALDSQHDDYVRGLHGALTSLAQIPGASSELLALRDQLFPQGLTHIKHSYRGEAGHGAMVAARLDDTLRARLRAVTLHDRNLLDLTQEWLALARQLGQVEEQRARLIPASPSPAWEINRARLAWIRMANFCWDARGGRFTSWP